MSVTTYRAIVRNGKIEPTAPLKLPEGSEVYVVVPKDINASIARRRANAWLVGMVGNMLMADGGELVQVGRDWVWRFDVFVTSLAHEPWGPIGTVDIDSSTGDIVDAEETRTSLYESGRAYQPPV